MDTKKEQDEGRAAPEAAEAAQGAQGPSASGAKPAVGSPLEILDMSTDLRRYLVSTPLARMPTGELYREPESLDATFDETKRNTRSEFNPANYREVLEAERQRRAERQPEKAETVEPHPEPKGSRVNDPESALRANQDQTALVDGRKRRRKRATTALVGLLALMGLGIVKWASTEGPATAGSVPSVTGAGSELPSSPGVAREPSPPEATHPTAREEDAPASTGANTGSRHEDASVAQQSPKEPKPARKATGATQSVTIEAETQQKPSEQPSPNRKVEATGARPSALPFQAKP